MQSKSKSRATAWVIIGLIAVACGPAADMPESAFQDFLITQHKESYTVAALCSAGESVVPLVIEKVKDRSLQRRVYAIAFLGSTDSKLPTEVLETITYDETESEGIRHSSLQALFMVDEVRGRQAARDFRERRGYIGQISNEILSVSDHVDYKRRSSACNITE